MPKTSPIILCSVLVLMTISVSTLAHADVQLAGLGGLLDKVKKGAEDVIIKTVEETTKPNNPQPTEAPKDQPKVEDVLNIPQTSTTQAKNAFIGNIPLANPPIVNYQFTKLVQFDSKSLSASFYATPKVIFSKFKLNQQGAVAFQAFDIKNKATGVYMADKGQLTNIASSDNGDFFENKGYAMSLGFNNNGKVAYIAEKVEGGDAIFLAEAGKKSSKVLDLLGDNGNIYSLSDDDAIYFKGAVNVSGKKEVGIFVLTNGKVTKIPDNYSVEAIDPSGKVVFSKPATNTNLLYWLNGKFQSIYSDNNKFKQGFDQFYANYLHYQQLAINKNGSFILPSFKNRSGPSAQKLSLVSNLQVTKIVEQDNNFAEFKPQIAISDNNNIAFGAKIYTSNKPKMVPGDFVFRYMNGQLESLGDIRYDGRLYINDSGTVVFHTPKDGGIFYGPDHVKHKVIVNSDKLFGLGIYSLQLLGLTNSGAVIFLVDLGGSKKMIVRADPL